MKKCVRILGLLLASPVLAYCVPEVDDDPGLDPNETVSAFCEKLFACPEAEAMAEYGSRSECEEVHLDDYESRDQVCQNLVLMLEDCLTDVNCSEIIGGCNDERLRLGQAGCSPF